MVRPLKDSETGQSEQPEDLDRELQELEDPTDPAQSQQSAEAAGGNLSVALMATENISEGSEVTISYTGVSGATNRRLMVQYGFVIPDNEHDRLDFELFEGYVGTTPLRGAPCASLSLYCRLIHTDSVGNVVIWARTKNMEYVTT